MKDIVNYVMLLLKQYAQHVNVNVNIPVRKKMFTMIHCVSH